MNLVGLLVFENPVWTSFFETTCFDELKDVHGICFDNIWIKYLFFSVLIHAWNVFCLDELVLFHKAILMIANGTLLDIMHYVVQPNIQTTQRV